MNDAPDVLIVGASGRAAAQSATRAGWRPWVVDLFGDADVEESAFRNRVISDYRELPAAIADWPSLPWMFTGAVENHFGLIRRLSQKGPLWGTSLEGIRHVRNPHRLAETLQLANCPALKVWKETAPPPPDGRWMLKPRFTAGGQGILPWNQATAKQPNVKNILKMRHIFQERVEGESLSAVFLSEAKETLLVGISRLLKANDPAPPFGYGGAIGPVRLVPQLERQIERQGQCVGQSFGLRGLWGIDFVSDGSCVWATEVNPRYTATVELYEHAYGLSLLIAHRRSCDDGLSRIDGFSVRNPPHPSSLPPGERRQNESRGPLACIGKVVIYADRDFAIPDWGLWIAARDSLQPDLPGLADRPFVGSHVLRGHPICSVLASGRTEPECREALHLRLVGLQSHFRKAGVRISFPGIGD